IASVETDKISLESGKRKLLQASWKADVNPGKYYAVATVTFDRESKNVDKVFSVGNMEIEVVKVETKNFKLGGVAKMEILLRSNWNEMIKDLYGELLIKDMEGDPVSDIKTASIDLLPHSEKPIIAYWETVGLREGQYSINLKLKFLDKVIEKQLVSYLSMDGMRTSLLSSTGQVIGGKAEIERNTILSIAIVILIILNIGWFIYFKKSQKKK
ncbi:MAG: hypothetical protein U9Q69_05105, partial [Nanoarchaeota archaeon]|nr:hypothetical protein [Nanoarchaeota archaeon]